MEPDRLMELLRSRRSVRRFDGRPLARPAIETLLEAARWAPSNHNRQGLRFVAVENAAEIARLAREVRRDLAMKLEAHPRIPPEIAGEIVHHASWFEEAPCLLLVFHKRPLALAGGLLDGVEGSELVSGEPLSAAMAVQNLLLMAHAMGLGACVLTAPLLSPKTLLTFQEAPAGFQYNCIVALGYPVEVPQAPRRKPLEHIVEYREGR